jgi:hypothetical protein
LHHLVGSLGETFELCFPSQVLFGPRHAIVTKLGGSV